MKVIFLDIDGVMNSSYHTRKKYNSLLNKIKGIYYKIKSKIKLNKDITVFNHKISEYCYTYDYQFKRLVDSTVKEKWEWLSEWCNENNIKICISSVWKHHFGTKEELKLEWWNKALIDLGFKSDTFIGITGSRRPLRGTEIKEFLDELENVEDYAILDDDSDMLEEQFNHFHHCDSYYGLTPNHLYRILRQFNKESNYSKLSQSLKQLKS